MATVTKQFRDDFEAWAAGRVAAGWFSLADVEEVREMVRCDLAPGPDLLRAGVMVQMGEETVSAAIDDHEHRFRLWADYLSSAVGTTQRPRADQSPLGRQAPCGARGAFETASVIPNPPTPTKKHLQLCGTAPRKNMNSKNDAAPLNGGAIATNAIIKGV